MIGLYYSSSTPIPTSYPKQKEIKPESELRFGYRMSFQYHGQIPHWLNHYNLLVGLEIPDVRIPNYYTPAQDMYNSQFCEENNKPETQVWYKTCTNVCPAVQTGIRKVHDFRYEIGQIYEEEFPAIIPNYKVGPIQEHHQLNKSPIVLRKKRFITDIILFLTLLKLVDMLLSRKKTCVSVLLVQVHGTFRKILFIVKKRLVMIYSYITL